MALTAGGIPGIGLAAARYAVGEFSVGGANILGGIPSESVISFSYTDNTNDQADDLSVTVADPSRTWMQSLPKKGSECTAKIQVFNWLMPGDSRELDCGTFFLDQIDFEGPPNAVSIKAVSVPQDGIKSTKRYRAWENTGFQQIAAQIAGEHGLGLVWDAVAAPIAKRIDQIEMPNLEFLRDRAKDYGLSLKLFNKQLVLYSEEQYEAKGAVYTIIYGASNIVNYSFSSKLDQTFASATDSYVNPETGELIEGVFPAPEPPEGQEAIDKYYERVESEGGGGGGGGAMTRASGLVDFKSTSGTASEAATTKAKSKLREKNKHEKEASLTIFGNPDILSGLCVELQGFGMFDDKWFVESSTHEIGASGYTTNLKLRAALKGY
jgi:phage protein D